MDHNSFKDKLRSFFGLGQEPPRNEFRNPIWGDDDDEDGDELYDNHNQLEINVFPDPTHLHNEMTKQVQEMLRNFSSMFGDMRSFFSDTNFENVPPMLDGPPESDRIDSNSLREYYLKPGFQNSRSSKEDIDLDGKISSNDISGLLKQRKDAGTMMPVSPFDGNMVPGRSFCKTIITTSVTKPDGTIETHRIVKNGNEVTEETTTTTPMSGEPRNPLNTGFNTVSPDVIYNNILSELASLWKNFH